MIRNNTWSIIKKEGILTRPVLFFYIIRPAPVLLILSSLCLVVLSATRTWAIISAQAGPVVATLSVIGLEGSLTGGLLAISRNHQDWWLPCLLRRVSTYLAVFVLVLVLIVTNTYSEIRALGVVVNRVVMDWLIVIFLGAVVPLLVVVNIENMASRINQYIAEYRRDLANWAAGRAGVVLDKPSGNGARRRARRAERLEALRALDGDRLADLDSLSRAFGVSVPTIKRDIRAILEKEEGGF